MSDPFPFAPEKPWEKPSLEDCLFYHSMDFPSGESVEGPWDMRGHFEEYLGGYPIAGKTLLDVGTASGFLAFSAEQAGAEVTAIDVKDSSEYDLIPFRQSLYVRDRAAWCARRNTGKRRNKNSFWYAWHEYGSHVEVFYVPLTRLPFWGRRFDVIVAGAIVVHLANPVAVIGDLAAMADEALIIAMTPVADSDEQTMHTANDWSDPEKDHGWWRLSRGLYRRVFENLGFDMEISPAPETKKGKHLHMSTIIARRRLQ